MVSTHDTLCQLKLVTNCNVYFVFAFNLYNIHYNNFSFSFDNLVVALPVEQICFKAKKAKIRITIFDILIIIDKKEKIVLKIGCYRNATHDS